MRMTRFLPLTLTLAVGATQFSTAALAHEKSTLLAPLFSDHAVLQRDRPISVWGRADPNERVTLTLGEDRIEALADGQGDWRARLPARGPGGPFTLTATTADAVVTAADVMIGDVWLCSGQSNMLLPVSRALNAPLEISGSSDEGIRTLTIPRGDTVVDSGEFAAPVAWALADPATIGDVSAACFFFGQELRRHHDIPMGLIVSARGGTVIEAWMHPEDLRSAGDHQANLNLLDAFASDETAAQARFVTLWQDWWLTRFEDRPWSDDAGADWTPAPRLGPWEDWDVVALENFDGMVWFRTRLALTRAQAAQSARLTLGAIDEADVVWINGRPLAAHGQGEQTYAVPANLLIAGENTVVVNVWDGAGDGGLIGPAGSRTLTLADGTVLDLDRQGWLYRRVEREVYDAPRAPWDARAGVAILGNAMIAPLQDYGLKGVLWYQGESNVRRRPERYGGLFSGLVQGWRRQFDNRNLPVIAVSLPAFGEPSSRPSFSGWAEVREGTRRAVLADDHAALAVAIDLGDRWDVHPGQKKEVGRRLARAARAVAYGEAIAPSGPEAVSARREADIVVVTFTGVTGGLVTHSGDAPLGFELCDQNQVCRYAPARVEGLTVRLTVPEVHAPVEIRYAWADAPVVNLFDEAGLPAGPFRLALD